YGASSNIIDKVYIEATEELGEKLAKRGHGLVFGAGAEGVMGASARGVERGGGKIIGIAPGFFNVDGMIFENCTELIRPDTMRERKKMLEEMSDAFIMAPGGIGTFDEFFEIITLKQLSRHTKAIAIFNVNNYFDDLLAMMEKGIKEDFIKEECRELYRVFENSDEMLDYLENYKAFDMDILNFKNI
ncbi:MAG: TIGR00730 family Rossman fold protein, partial [Clostridia bacterium]|nr:TIGR00730 family Rossman fold protein [Clostridia bacterium]